MGYPHSIQYATLFLALVAVFVTTPIIYFYINGEKIRMSSKFAARIAEQRDAEEEEEKKKGGGSARVREAEDEEVGPQDPEYYKRKRRQEKADYNEKHKSQYLEVSEKQIGPMSKRITPSHRYARR